MRAMIMTNRPADSVEGEHGRVKTSSTLLTSCCLTSSMGNRVELKPGQIYKILRRLNRVEWQQGRVKTSIDRLKGLDFSLSRGGTW